MLLSPPSRSPATGAPIHLVVGHRRLRSITQGSSIGCSPLAAPHIARYNKTLLGDDLGKFPAPLFMNTFHFAMQVVLSTAMTWFWPQRFQPRVTMSWRDYFMRGKLVKEITPQ
ncbi:unnamed protein product [Camellia sinensis]